MLVTSSPSTAILLNRSVTDHHRYQVFIHTCSVHLHLLQVQDGAVFQEGWRNSVGTTYLTLLYYFIQPWKTVVRSAAQQLIFYVQYLNISLRSNHSTCSFIVLLFSPRSLPRIVQRYSHKGAEAQPYYVVASGWEVQKRFLGKTLSETKAEHWKNVSEIREATKKQLSRHVGWQVTLVKTRIDPEDTPEYQDHLEGQAQRQMQVTSSPSYR